MEIVLKKVRLAFPTLFEPKAFNAGEPACSASFIIDQSDKANLKVVTDAIRQVATEKWKDKAGDMLKQLKAKGDLCLHEGAEKSEYAGFDGNYYVSSRNKVRPIVVDRNKAPLTAADGRPYGGCYVNVSLDVWAQANEYGKRVNAKLLAVQFVEDGEAFGGGAMGSADVFDSLDGDAPSTSTSVAGAGDDDPLFG